jgi:hypothetical protein
VANFEREKPQLVEARVEILFRIPPIPGIGVKTLKAESRLEKRSASPARGWWAAQSRGKMEHTGAPPSAPVVA